MSQHARMDASTEPTSNRTLPFELIELIASQLDQPSLACFALVSKACYKTACPALYHTLRLGVARYTEEEVALDMARKLSRSIKALSRRKELCRMVQAVEFEGFGWIGREEWLNLQQVLYQSEIRSLAFSPCERDDDFELDDSTDVLLDRGSVIWETVLRLPELHTVDLDFGYFNDFALNLDQNSAIKRVKLTNMWLDFVSGSLVASFTHLILRKTERNEYIDWFPHELFQSLCVLVLDDMYEGALGIIAESAQTFASTSPSPSPLRSFTVKRTELDSQGVSYLDGMLRALASPLFPALRTLEIRTGYEGSLAASFRDLRDRFLSNVPTHFPQLRELTLVGDAPGETSSEEDGDEDSEERDGTSNVSAGDSWLDDVVVLSELSELKFLTLSLPRQAAGRASAAAASVFQFCPSLVYLALELPTRGMAWVVLEDVDTNRDATARRRREAPIRESTNTQLARLKPLVGDIAFDVADEDGWSMSWYKETLGKLGASSNRCVG